MRLPGTSISLYRCRVCSNGLCYHILTLSRLRNHNRHCDLWPHRQECNIRNKLPNFPPTVLCIYIRSPFHHVSDSHQPSEMETSSCHGRHRLCRLRCQLLLRPTLLFQRPNSQHSWGLRRGRPWQPVLSPPTRSCGCCSPSRHLRTSPFWPGGQWLPRQWCHFCQPNHRQRYRNDNGQQRDAGGDGHLYQQHGLQRWVFDDSGCDWNHGRVVLERFGYLSFWEEEERFVQLLSGLQSEHLG